MKTRQEDKLNGILVIDKPAGMTSHDVINRLRRKYGQKRFGHAGTLDPDASGVLVVLAGRATKCLQFLPDTDKEYIAQLELGSETDTDDASGEVINRAPVNLDFSLKKYLDCFKGPLHQRVPMTSAKKVHGKKLLEYQREGKEVGPMYTDVVIWETEVLDSETLTFRVLCSSGTYIRSLCRDLAKATGNLGHMKTLRRTRACGFSIDQAEPMDAEIHTVYPLEIILKGIPQITGVPEEDVRNGKHLHLETESDRVLILNSQGDALAVYDRHHNDVFSCTRGLW